MSENIKYFEIIDSLKLDYYYCTSYIMCLSLCCCHSSNIIIHARYDMMSPGEMQRLSFARLFFHKPKFAGITTK